MSGWSQCVDSVDEFLVDRCVVGLVATGRLVFAGAPDIRELRDVCGSVDVGVLLVGVCSDPGDDDFVVLGEHDVHAPVGVEAQAADVGVAASGARMR